MASFGYKNPVLSSHETYYASAIEPSRLLLCKISVFHSGDYEECRLLGFKNPVRTSQETYYGSATEPTQLMLFRISGFHGGDYEEYCVWNVTPCDSCKNKSHTV
jgi:hypothetical protein